MSANTNTNTNTENIVLGIDIGGSGIKGAPVNIATGELTVDERLRLATPLPATPKAIAETVANLVKHFEWTGRIGAGFPAAIQHGIVRTASNIDKSWIGENAETLLGEASGISPTQVRVLNDADVAGLAEIRFGAGKDVKGLVLMITLGTGIGTALFVDGVLVPNTELGHIEIDGGKPAEPWASDAARDRDNLKWPDWAARVNTYLSTMENLFWPDLIIVGGGVSKKPDKWMPHLKLRTPIVTATLKNNAGIVGAACAASDIKVTASQTGAA